MASRGVGRNLNLQNPRLTGERRLAAGAAYAAALAKAKRRGLKRLAWGTLTELCEEFGCSSALLATLGREHAAREGRTR